ncbi:MAG: lipid A-modifier LpxR family protein, partial [Bacteroidota bacterium]
MIHAMLRVGLLSVVLSYTLSGQSSPGSRYFSAEIANDVFFLPIKTDRYFTSGMQFEWGRESEVSFKIIDRGKAIKRKYWRINQDLFTPKAIDSLRLMPNDRPFASYLIVSKGSTFSIPLLGFSLRQQWTGGVLGKYSQGGRMQNAFHGMIDFAE